VVLLESFFQKGNRRLKRPGSERGIAAKNHQVKGEGSLGEMHYRKAITFRESHLTFSKNRMLRKGTTTFDKDRVSQKYRPGNSVTFQDL